MTAPLRREGRRREGGQNLIIFALIAVVLFVAAGLSVDAGIAYLASDSAERAAAAAALSGVSYLPDDPTNAVKFANSEASSNGFTDGVNGVTVTATPTGPNRLRVDIATHTTPTFLRLLGFTTTVERRTATAEFLRPVSLGQPGVTQGADFNSLGSGGSNYYILRSEGWATGRSQGDAYTPTPNNGIYTANPPDVHRLSSSVGTETADPTTSDLGGYNYLVYLPAGVTGDVQVFNPIFGPDAPSANNAFGYNYHEWDSSLPNAGSRSRTDYSAMEYTVYKVNSLFTHSGETKLSQVTYLPMDANNLNNGGPNPSYTYFDSSGNVQTQAVPGGVGGLASTHPFHHWISVNNYSAPAGSPEAKLVKGVPTTTSLSGGANGQYYRLKVDTLDWQGNVPDHSSNNGSNAHKGYAVQFSQSGGPGCNGASVPCLVSALNDACIYTPLQSTSGTATFSVPIFGLGAEYAGKTMSVNIFDPGDVGGNGTAFLKIVQPAYGSTPQQIAAVSGVSDLGPQLGGGGAGTTVTPVVAGQAYVKTYDSSANPRNAFNGHWLQFSIPVPTNYSPTGLGYYNLQYDVSTGSGGGAITAGDTITMQVGFNGSPVHLLP